MTQIKSIPTEQTAKLCSYCRQIPFDSMILPYQWEVDQSGYNDGGPVSGFWNLSTGKVDSKIDLGMMSRILANEEGCDICVIMSDILRESPESPFGPRTTGVYKVGSKVQAFFDPAVEKDRPIYFKFLSNWRVKDPEDHLKPLWKERVVLHPHISWKDDAGGEAGDYGFLHIISQTGKEKSYGPNQTNPLQHDLVLGARSRPAQIDWSWVKRWMETCVHEHQSCGMPVKAKVKSDTRIRLVDVQKMCIVENVDLKDPTTNYQYAAVSYVWGGLEHKLDLRRSNIEELSQPGGLDPAKLSNTLSDLVQVAQKLDIPYVWADALCICQDDREDKQIQIALMNVIYQYSFVTIVAAAGNDVDSGLPGLRPNDRNDPERPLKIQLSDSRRTASHLEYDSVTLARSYSSTVGLNFSPITALRWNSRMWTYQERMLSRRVLIFTAEQLYWACNEAEYHEDNCLEIPQHRLVKNRSVRNPLGWSLHTALKSTGWSYTEEDHISRVWRAYSDIVSDYTRRYLTYAGDVHSAFEGILAAISEEADDEILLGHPRSRFEMSLAWGNMRSVKRRLEKSSMVMTAMDTRIVFPSWSWMGWEGESTFNITKKRETNGFTTLIECFTHRTEPKLRLVPVRAFEHGEESLGKLDWLYLSRRSPTIKDITKYYPYLTEEKLNDTADETLIFFWAETATLKVQYANMGLQTDTGYAREEQFPAVLDARGEVVGELAHIEPAARPLDEVAEFVAIGVIDDPSLEGIPGYEPKNQVLHVGWRVDAEGNRCEHMERISFGEIAVAAWKAAKPTRKLIALG